MILLISTAWLKSERAQPANDNISASAMSTIAKRFILRLLLVRRRSTFYAVAAPLFSRDSQALIFSAAGGPAASQRGSDQFISTVRPNVMKHNIPSGWWRVDLATGKITSLMRIGDTGLYGDFSPDGQHIAFVAATGLYLMNPDGSNLTQIMNYGPDGTVSWIP